MEATLFKSDSIAKLTEAVINVMIAVKGIDKTASVGVGNNGYKGVADQEVKKIIGEAMEKNGLAIFPIGVDESCEVTDWEETYNGQAKRKQQVFVKVKTTYLLAHESGEFIQICGYGHGVDNQDKAAGKATTYALKYTLLYTFMVATGKIDDADMTHSDEIPVPQNRVAVPPAPAEPSERTLADRELLLATTVEAVKIVWDSHPKLHTDKEFIRECNRFKAKLTPEIPQ